MRKKELDSLSLCILPPEVVPETVLTVRPTKWKELPSQRAPPSARSCSTSDSASSMQARNPPPPEVLKTRLGRYLSGLTTGNPAQEKRRGQSGHPTISPTPEVLPFHGKHAEHNSVPLDGNICTINTAVDTSNCSMKGFKQTPIWKKLTRPQRPFASRAEEMSWKAEGCNGGRASMVNN